MQSDQTYARHATCTMLFAAGVSFGFAFGADQPVAALAAFVFLIAAVLFAKDA